VNKIDSKSQEESLYQFYKLGIGEPIPISSQTGKGCGDLLDKIISFIKERTPKEQQNQKIIKVGIFGRQNVGKSSLFNAILGKTKVIVSDIPGTTRDAIDTLISYNNHNILLVDTAGIKRKNKINFGIEKFSIKKSLGTIEKCDIALMVISACEGASRQDLRIASQILKNKKGIILVINKWDIIKNNKKEKQKEIAMERFIKYMQEKFSKFFWAPVIFVSAKFKTNIQKILELVLISYKEKNKILTKEELDNFYKSVILASPPPKMKLAKKQPKIRAFLQEKAPFPKFSLILGPKEIIPPFYFRFLEKELRKRFGFYGTPIEIITKIDN